MDYDVPHFYAELDNYLIKNDVSRSVKNRIRLVIEEIVQQILLPHYQKPYIRVKAEYSIIEDKCMVYISYKGDEYNIENSDNDISMALIQNSSEEFKYRFVKEDEEPNHIEILIKS